MGVCCPKKDNASIGGGASSSKRPVHQINLSDQNIISEKNVLTKLQEGKMGGNSKKVEDCLQYLRTMGREGKGKEMVGDVEQMGFTAEGKELRRLLGMEDVEERKEGEAKKEVTEGNKHRGKGEEEKRVNVDVDSTREVSIQRFVEMEGEGSQESEGEMHSSELLTQLEDEDSNPRARMPTFMEKIANEPTLNREESDEEVKQTQSILTEAGERRPTHVETIVSDLDAEDDPPLTEDVIYTLMCLKNWEHVHEAGHNKDKGPDKDKDKDNAQEENKSRAPAPLFAPAYITNWEKVHELPANIVEWERIHEKGGDPISKPQLNTSPSVPGFKPKDLTEWEMVHEHLKNIAEWERIHEQGGEVKSKEQPPIVKKEPPLYNSKYLVQWEKAHEHSVYLGEWERVHEAGGEVKDREPKPREEAGGTKTKPYDVNNIRTWERTHEHPENIADWERVHEQEGEAKYDYTKPTPDEKPKELPTAPPSLFDPKCLLKWEKAHKE